MAARLALDEVVVVRVHVRELQGAGRARGSVQLGCEHTFVQERDERVAAMLAEGVAKVRIADRLEISRETVDRIAAANGLPARRRAPSRVNWEEVRRHYEAGHTAADTQGIFGLTPTAWRCAIARGDITPRPRAADQQPPGRTRKAVAELHERGLRPAQIADEVGIKASTVCYHLRRLGVPANTLYARRFDWAEIREAYESGLSMRECRLRFGFSAEAWRAAVERGDIEPRSHLIPIEVLLVRGRVTSRGHLKVRLVAAGLKGERCEECGISEWLDEPLSMQLHHVNGDGTDNRLENLQFLCPNCHSQTDTYGGRNGHRRPERHLELVEPPPEADSEEPTGT